MAVQDADEVGSIGRDEDVAGVECEAGDAFEVCGRPRIGRNKALFNCELAGVASEGQRTAEAAAAGWKVRRVVLAANAARTDSGRYGTTRVCAIERSAANGCVYAAM